MRLILASTSPRRSEILKNAGYDFEIRTAIVDESLPAGIVPEQAVKILSKLKADAVKREKGETILAADTLVSIDGKILGKPKNEDEAFNMLKDLSDRKHDVYTGVCIINDSCEINFAEKSEVIFDDLTNEQIYEYIRSGEPMDKAGAYGIQGAASSFARVCSGSTYNVMGLPIERIKEYIE